jgi:hypothetical protein
MRRNWSETKSLIENNKLAAVTIGRVAEIAESTVRNALKGRNEPSRVTLRVINEAIDILLSNDVSGSVRQDSNSTPLEPEAQADLETAKVEHQILTDMYLEDAPKTMAAALAARRSA